MGAIKEMEPIAIVGIGCRFPDGKAGAGGVQGPRAFWSMLTEGVDAIVEVPDDRWNSEVFYHPDPASAPGTVGTRLGGFLDGIDRFDPGFFGISPREAAHMDPQQRLLLEVSWEALEDGGLPIEKLDGEKVGVFVGIAAYDYAEIQHGMNNRDLITAHTNTGLALSIAANRISYIFNFTGPSVAVDTACSSSLVACHLACQSLAMGESRVALVGGVNAILKPEPTIGFSRASMLAPDGRCKTFDARANGYTRGEGAGVVVLKRLSDAQADGDRIYAVIRGTAVNQDGHTIGMTVPGEQAQAAMLREAYARAGIDPAEIQYVEAHGTGTPVGDPIETRALGAVLSAGREADRPCILGSVKTNIGHLEAAAGIAGLIKASLAIHHRHIPPNLNFETPNPEIPFDDLRLAVADRLQPWPQDGRPARAGVNSFGFGGTNAHVVLEQAPLQTAEAKDTCDDAASHGADWARVLPLSARANDALQATAQAWRDRLAGLDDVDMDAVCHIASVRRSHHDHRLALVARSRAEFVDKLNDYLEGRTGNGVITTGERVATTPERGPAFVFSGMGPQWWGMGQQLLREEPVYRAMIERCDALLSRHADWSLIEEMTRDEATSRMNETQISQPANFALQVALFELWKSWGVEPSAIVGHSTGEVAAFYAAGVMDLEESIRVTFHRSRLQQRASGAGKMIAAALTREQAEETVAPYDGRVSVAAVNGPSAVTLAGDEEPLREIAAMLKAKGIFNRFLTVEVPFHSHHMDPLHDDLLASLADLRNRAPDIPLYSTVTGARVEGLALDENYWWRNVRDSVLFGVAVDAMIEDGHDSFLEVGPHPVLSSMVSECMGARSVKGTVLPSLRRHAEERAGLLTTLANLHLRGYPVAWQALYPTGDAELDLPRYPWRHERYWQESRVSLDSRLADALHPLLGRRAEVANPTFEATIDKRRLPYLNDHRVQGTVLFPGAGYVEIGFAAGRELFAGKPFVVEELRFDRALMLADDKAMRLQVGIDPTDGGYVVHSRAIGDEGAWTRHATGRLRQAAPDSQHVDIDAVRGRCADDLSDYCYSAFRERGLEYGPDFQGIQAIWRGEGEALARVRLPDTLADEAGGYRLHPSLLDACFQVMMGTLLDDGDDTTYLPVGIDRVRVDGDIDHDREFWAHARLLTRNSKTLEGDIRLVDADGRVLAEVEGFSCQALESRTAEQGEQLDRFFHAFDWEEKARRGESAEAAADHVVAPGEIADAIAPAIASLADELDRARYYREVEPKLNALGVAYVLDAFKRLRRPLATGQRLTVETLAKTLGIDPQHSRLFSRLFGILAEAGVIHKMDVDWKVDKLPGQTDPAALLTELREGNPELAPELDLIARCGEKLAEVLRGEEDPLQLIFPDGALDDAEVLYRDSRTFGTYNRMVEEAVRAVVDRLPDGRRLRVLEIGAGTGALASHILDMLPAERTEYVYTDISTAFTAKAEQRFADAYPFVQYRILDIEKDPVAQGFDLGVFDLVLASDAVHATRNMRATMANVAKLMAPEGLLALLELTNPPNWFDLVFGMLKGWWLFEDIKLRKTHPWMGREAWRRVFDDTGFTDMTVLGDRDDAEPLHSVFLARGPNAEAKRAAATDPLDQALAEPASWLILADGGDVGERMAERLAKRGQVPVLVRAGDKARSVDAHHAEIRIDNPADVEDLIARIEADYPACRGVVHLWNLDAAPFDDVGDDASGDALDDAEARGPGVAIDLVKALAAREAAEPPRLVLVTRAASRLEEAAGRPVDPVQAPLLGLGRVIANEHPDLHCAVVDISAQPDDAELDNLLAECVLDDGEAEVALRGKRRFVHRLNRVGVDALKRDALRPRPVEPGQPFKLDVIKTGALENLILRESARRTPAPGEIEIEAHATGLNFRDVMKVMGIYPTEGDEELRLGDECAGTVVAVGEGVKDFRVGDRVAAIASGFSNFVTVSTDFVARIPDHVGFEQAATIPITFVTSYYALHHLAHIAKGERVLIHAAAGGVGLSAIQIAQAAGAEIFATAGSPEKHDFLRSLGVEHIMDSRSLDFADQVLEATNGEGVDIVLNSLAGEAIPKSLSLLRAYGRFLEIGKTDIYQNSKLGLRPFRDNLSYFAIDLDRVFKQRPALAGELFAAVMARFHDKALHPLPLRSFAISQAENAFRYMAQAKHIGKVVLSMQDADARVIPPAYQPLPFKADGAYLMTGGLGGFGVAVANWMVDNGARHLVLAGRGGAASDEAKRAVEAMRAKGAEVTVAKVDVTDEAQLAALLDDVRAKHPPLKGVLHAAMVLDDGFLVQLDRERLHKVMAPKVKGAWNLHRLTLDDPLEMFVAFSSFAAMIGNPGQGNYAAANSFLDALVQYRRTLGRPGLVVDWGAIGGVGYVAEHDEIAKHFERQGLTAFPVERALAVLEHLLANNIAHVGAVDMDWAQWGKYMPEVTTSPRFAHLAQTHDKATADAGADGAAILDTLLATAPEERQPVLEGVIRGQLATVLGTSADKLDGGQPLADLGLDSLMAVELSCLIEDNLGVNTSAIELTQAQSVSKLAERLLNEIASQGAS